LNIDINLIGEREMTRTFNHALAAFAALALTYAMFAQAAAVPAGPAIIAGELA
jgi:hypothetical protein